MGERTQCDLVTATAYNAAGLPTNITYGNAGTGYANDVDTFSYDANTNRPVNLTTSISPSAGTCTVTTGLTWNANSSLQQMAYIDGSASSPESQTCSYAADDLSRIASVNCGGAWEQGFSYDALGNITKSGSASYAASYNRQTNQVSGNVTASYDANGNQTESANAWLTWNAAGQPATINPAVNGMEMSPTLNGVYDALGRLVEVGASGGPYTQFVYSPAGTKMAVYSGGLAKGTIPLPGGETAIYNSGGLSYIRHTDWLGSSRLATTWNHTVYAKEAYAPFGEVYNEAGTADRSFTGQDQNVATGSGGSGAYDFLFRKYDPSAGRWLSPDPKGWKAVNRAYPQSLNRYAYVQNNPMRATDPDGEACVTTNDDGSVSIDNQGPIGDACTGNGGIYVPGDMQASDINDLLAGLMSFSMVDSTGATVSYGSGDAADRYNFNGVISGSESEALQDMRTALTGDDQSDGEYLDSYSFGDDQWLNNGNFKPGYELQDDQCSSPMPQSMNSSPLLVSGCTGHDQGYMMYHCNSSSWYGGFVAPGPCTMVNLEGAVAIVVSQGIVWIGKMLGKTW